MIQINSPCHQNFSKMPKNGSGCYCISCQKTVVDFTNMNEVELLNYFKLHQNQEICGRVKATRLSKQNAFEQFLFNSKRYINQKVNVKPLRIALLGLNRGY